MTRTVYFQIAALSLSGLLLAGETAVLLRTPISAEPISTQRDSLQFGKAHAEIDLPENPMATLFEIQARPLFLKSRRPYQAPAPQIADTAPPAPAMEATIAPESFTLKGVFLASSLSRALIVSPANPEGIWVAHGGEIEGWKIEQIAAAHVRLGQRQKTAVLTLYRNVKSRD